jgi:hypothetical protein
MQHGDDVERGNLIILGGNILAREDEITFMLEESQVDLLSAFPPCTDMAVSGAKHLAAKKLADPAVEDKALALVYCAKRIGDKLGCPYFIENPVSTLATLWRKPDYTFHPRDFGGYLSDGDLHPTWSNYIPPRDAYDKLTCLWTGGGYTLPDKKVVPKFVEGFQPQMASLGGKSLKTKNIRSATPRGFALANFLKYGVASD